MMKMMSVGLLAGLLLVNAGCHCTGCKHPFCRKKEPPCATFVPPPAPAPLLAPGIAPRPSNALTLPPDGFPQMPPGAVTNPPPGASILQPGQQAPSISSVPPGAGGRSSNGFDPLPSGAETNPPLKANNVQPTEQPPSITNVPPAGPSQSRTEADWQPAEARAPMPRNDATRDVSPPRVQLYAPEQIDKDSIRDSVSVLPPQVDKERKPANEPPPQKPSVQGTLPAIKQFAVVKENIYAGLRPPLDGLDWLQNAGVKTIVQIRLFGEDDSADRKQVEKRDMNYVAFEVSPQTLTKAKVDEFIKVIRDGSKQGMFVYDQDGSLAGSMWYLYLRMGESYDDDASQLRARPLGLQASGDMWLAVQKLLSENSR